MELERYIRSTYGVEADYPFEADGDSAVFRHGGSRKWFALAMRIPRHRLGLTGEERIDVVNLKCSPAVIGSLRGAEGFFPAYHMNKEHWITAALDGSAPDETLKTLLAMSYDATAPRRAAPHQRET